MRIIFSLNFLYVLLIAAQVAAIVFLCVFVPSVLPLAAAFAGTWLLSAITACILLSKDGGTETKCAWFTVIAALPVVGSVIYLIASKKGSPYGVYRALNEPLTPLGKCAKSICGFCEAPYYGAVYYGDGAKLFESMFFEIARAKKSVCAEFFIVRPGVIFDGFLKALKSASENGAKIMVLIDGVGSAFKLKKRDVKRLKDAGAEVKFFKRLIPLPRARLNFRDHRKIVAVDGKIAFTGGINLADEYANIKSPYGVWKDGGVSVCGGAASMLEGAFYSMWLGNYQSRVQGGGEEICLPFCDSPPKSGFCEELFAQKISAATQKIHILTPYFCVGERLKCALSFAAKRGVDVKVILPHVPDKRYAWELSKASAAELIKSGVKFFEYSPGFMHAKTLVCDGEAVLGSYNFDFRSMRLNYECGILFGGKIAACAEEDFLNCLSLSEPLKEGKISPAKRFSRFILRLFAPLI